jgi:hypothetical protein
MTITVAFIFAFLAVVAFTLSAFGVARVNLVAVGLGLLTVAFMIAGAFG